MSDTVAARLDRAAVQLGQSARERETDAEAAAAAIHRVARLPEQLEQAGQHVGRDARAVVLDGNDDVAAFR